jgi:ribosomal protein L16 Arg81 hydroxylase
MECRFLDNLTLRSLLAPVSEDDFRAHYWEKKPLIIQRQISDFYANLFTLQDFEDAIMRSLTYVMTANEAKRKTSTPVPGLERLLQDMRDGDTVVLPKLNRHEPKLGRMCRQLSAELGHPSHTNLYLTPPHAKGFTPHWDHQEAFILQLWGSKHWKIERERRSFWTGNDERDDDLDLRGDPDSVTLKPGDLIYIPRGFVHAVEAGPEPSLHITLEVQTIRLETLVHATVTAARRRDASLAMALPLGFMQGGRDEIVRRVTAALRHIADETFVGAVVDQYLDELVSKYALDISGQLLDFYQPAPLRLKDVAGPRPGIVYRMHVEKDQVRVIVGSRSIAFPGFFRDALAFALNTPAYRVDEIPGELKGEEKIAFVARLMEEGLAIRK